MPQHDAVVDVRAAPALLALQPRQLWWQTHPARRRVAAGGGLLVAAAVAILVWRLASGRG